MRTALTTLLVVAVLHGEPIDEGEKRENHEIEDGKYTLTLESMFEKKGNDFELSCEVSVKGTDVTLDTKGATGNEIRFKGEVMKKRFVVGVTDAERGDLITYHLIGEVGDKGIVAGRYSVFKNHTRSFGGTWVLKKL